MDIDDVVVGTEDGPGRKDDDGKLMYELLPPDAIRELVFVYTIGANRYGKDNYLKGMDWSRVMGALQRHYFAWAAGEQRDPKDRQMHLASVAWCALSLMVYEMRGIGDDDRQVIDQHQKGSSVGIDWDEVQAAIDRMRKIVSAS